MGRPEGVATPQIKEASSSQPPQLEVTAGGEGQGLLWASQQGVLWPP